LSTKELVIPERLMNEILIKLQDDGYFRYEAGQTEWFDVRYEERKNYLLTFQGELFQQAGGYTQRVINADRNEKRIERNDNLLAKGTLLVAIGTIGLLLWEIGKFLTPAFQYFFHCEFVWQK